MRTGRGTDNALFADDAPVADDEGPIERVEACAGVDDRSGPDSDLVYSLQDGGVCDDGAGVDGDGRSWVW